ncbi:hypothetical protein [Eikenella exigua]|uniref:hypothetical protein n=1 Tax=Eikenella exigua TaxID=2528037 RepID=UPI00129AC543|nr:hypothetical protein [Eikenella exigua]
MDNNLGWLDRKLQNAILVYCAKKPETSSSARDITDELVCAQDREIVKPEFSYLEEKFPNKTPSPAHSSKCRNLEPNPTYEYWKQIVIRNICYLAGHDLILFNQTNLRLRITSKGIDFIQQDNGLSAILGVQTVKIHADTLSELKALLADKLDQSGLPEAEKAKLQEKLAEYGDVGIQHLITKLLDAGVQTLPQLISTLGIPGLFN